MIQFGAIDNFKRLVEVYRATTSKTKFIQNSDQKTDGTFKRGRTKHDKQCGKHEEYATFRFAVKDALHSTKP